MRRAAADAKGDGQMKKDVILHCRNGQKLEVNLARPFRCEEKELKVIMAEAGAQLNFHFDELSSIFFLKGFCPVNVVPSDDNLEEVVTIDNTHYLIHTETAGKNSEGFYKDAIKRNIGVEQLRSLAIEEGMRTLRMDGIMKVFRGITDYEQVNKVCL